MRKPKFRSVTVRVSSSTANLGPGFDVFSLALRKPSLKVSVRFQESSGLRVVNHGAYGSLLPSNPKTHSGAVAMMRVLEDFNLSPCWVLDTDAAIPVGKGLGASGASAVGAVAAINSAYALELTKEKLVQYASYGEPDRHADNVAASACGGFNIISSLPSKPELDKVIRTFSPPADLGIVVIVPNVEKESTDKARKAIPEYVSKEDHIRMIGYASKVSAGFAAGRTPLILENLPWDVYVERARADAGIYGRGISSDFLIAEKVELQKRYGIAETISGAGPSRILWYRKEGGAKEKLNAAIEFVSKRLNSLGYKVEYVIRTQPSKVGFRQLVAKAVV